MSEAVSVGTRIPKVDKDKIEAIAKAEGKHRNVSNVIAEILDHCLNQDNLSCITKLFPKYIQKIS